MIAATHTSVAIEKSKGSPIVKDQALLQYLSQALSTVVPLLFLSRSLFHLLNPTIAEHENLEDKKRSLSSS